MTIRPRRSLLYMPGSNPRALDKARTLPADGLILDLEDAVAPDAKALAREQIIAALAEGGYGHRELLVRINALSTEWGAEDVRAISAAATPPDAVLIPKVSTAEDVKEAISAFESAGCPASVDFWIMIETPLGVLNAMALACGSPRLRVLVMGTSDLVKELRATHAELRANISYALQRCVLCARAAGLDVLDGVHLDFRNLESFRSTCEQGRSLGFDGKTLIHPTQIEIANSTFGYSVEQIEDARAVLGVWEVAQAAGKGVAELDGRLIENLHAAEAQRILAFAESLDRRG